MLKKIYNFKFVLMRLSVCYNYWIVSKCMLILEFTFVKHKFFRSSLFMAYRSICMAAIGYKSPISFISTNEQLFGEKRLYAKFKIDISKTEWLVCVYTDRRPDGRMWINRLISSCWSFIYIYILQGLRRFLLSVTNTLSLICRKEFIYPF